jgi:multidrug resistance protein MdtO
MTIFFLIPQMVSITSLVLLIAGVSALFGWVAAGSERIAYAGLQAAFAYYLAVFQGYEPGTNLTTIRDRVIGILLGTVVSAIVFRYVWPEHAADDLRRTLRRLLDNVSKLLLIPKPGVPVEADGSTATSLHRTLAKDLDSVLVLSEQTAVENVVFRHAKSFSPALLSHLTPRIQALCLLTTALWRRTKIEEWQRLAEPVQVAEAALRAVMADYLRQVSEFLNAGRGPKECELDLELAAWNTTTEGLKGNDRPRLIRRLVTQIRELV